MSKKMTSMTYLMPWKVQTMVPAVHGHPQNGHRSSERRQILLAFDAAETEPGMNTDQLP